MTDRMARTIVEAVRLDRWDARRVDEHVDRALDLGVGGFVLFGGEAGAVATLTDRIRTEADRDMWIAADLERGAGQQFRGLTELPPPAALAGGEGAQGVVAEAAAITAREALSVGVNWVLAPVLDLDAEPDNPIVATRSFGADPTRVSDLGRRWIASCQDAGAMACGKHFPGHGRTLTDSHIELPVVQASAEEMDLDLEPFRRVADLTGSMMAAHVAYPSLGANRPATVSAEIVTELLRVGLGFEGLVATDAMIMAGIGGDDAVAAVAAIRAGCDVVLYPSDAAETLRALRRTADEDPAFATRVADAIGRSDRALSTFGIAKNQASRGGGGGGDGAVHFAEATIVDGSGGLEGWVPTAATSVIPMSDDPDVGPPAGRDGPLGTLLTGRLRSAGWEIETHAPLEPGSAPAPASSAGQRIVVLAATPRGWKGHGGPSPEVVARVRAELAGSDRALVVLLGHARWLEDLGVPGIGAWSTESIMEYASALWIDRRVRDGSA